MSHLKKILAFTILFLLAACSSTATPSSTYETPSPTREKTSTPTAIPVRKTLVPNFDHIVFIVFENQEFDNIIGNSEMPNFNKLADEHTLLNQYYAVRHPSLPNYIALIGGDTFGITENCEDCFINAPSLPDLIETSGRTWKTYQEDMPEPCFVGDDGDYVQKHNPFIYFDPIRLDRIRCRRSIVPLDMLQKDIDAGTLPNFIFITPNLCNAAHDCSLDIADKWLADQLDILIPALDKDGSNYLIIMMFEEGYENSSCCGLPEGDAGGHVPVILLSPQAKSNFQDGTPYTHYSLLKTIAEAWGLPYLGHANDQESTLITAPWK
jgi:phospholipase C